MTPTEALARALQEAGEAALGRAAPDGPLIGVAEATLPRLAALGYEVRAIACVGEPCDPAATCTAHRPILAEPSDD